MRPVRPAAVLVSTLVFALGSAGAAHAARPTAWADSSGALPVAAAAHRPGRWSLDFAINDNFTLGSFKGTSLSATRTTSPSGAWRFGLGYSISSSHDIATDIVDPDSARDLHSDIDDAGDGLSLTGVVMRLHRFHSARRVGAYWGLGPAVTWQRSHDETVISVGTGSPFQVQNRYAHDVTLGLDLDLGVEAFVARDISLFGQYASSGGYRFARTVNRTQLFDSITGAPITFLDERVDRRHAWFLSPGGVRLGVSLYL